jgi:hypothetical protein
VATAVGSARLELAIAGRRPRSQVAIDQERRLEGSATLLAVDQGRLSGADGLQESGDFDG